MSFYISEEERLEACDLLDTVRTLQKEKENIRRVQASITPCIKDVIVFVAEKNVQAHEACRPESQWIQALETLMLRFEKMSAHNNVIIPETLYPALGERLLKELHTNAVTFRHTGNLEKMLLLTLHQGESFITVFEEEEFQIFRRSRGIFKQAARNNKDPRAWLRKIMNGEISAGQWQNKKLNRLLHERDGFQKPFVMDPQADMETNVRTFLSLVRERQAQSGHVFKHNDSDGYFEGILKKASQKALGVSDVFNTESWCDSLTLLQIRMMKMCEKNRMPLTLDIMNSWAPVLLEEMVHNYKGLQVSGDPKSIMLLTLYQGTAFVDLIAGSDRPYPHAPHIYKKIGMSHPKNTREYLQYFDRTFKALQEDPEFTLFQKSVSVLELAVLEHANPVGWLRDLKAGRVNHNHYNPDFHKKDLTGEDGPDV